MHGLDETRFARHFSEFVSLADAGSGLASYIEGLEAKHRLFAEAVQDGKLARLDLEGARVLLETVFTARRRLFPLIEALGEDAFRDLLGDLAQGDAPVDARLAAFCDALPYPAVESRETRALNRKLRGAARDFAAELLHFADPLAHPLMTRWVWDAGTSSGALRELMAVPENATNIPLAAAYETFGETRRWLMARIAGQGIYRDQHWWVDLTLAMAYVGYFRAMTGGALGSDFMRGSTPQEQLAKLLGIEAERAGGRSRVKTATTLH
jgi:hypothetical protein